MRTNDFDYDLPDHLIAQAPCEVRSHSRLLYYSRQNANIQHFRFNNILDLLNPGDLLVFNNTRVIPARLFGQKETGGKVELLIERLIDKRQCLAHLKASKTPKAGSRITLSDASSDKTYTVTVKGREDDLFVLHSADDDIATIMQRIGHIPLPPYINRDDSNEDFSRYQTVYAETPGAVAAPTAGLHFDESVLERIRSKGVDSAYVTLHVGAGTFQPVRSEHIEDHNIHREYLTVPQSTVNKCKMTRQNGGRIIAVGTTSVRSLEAASMQGNLQSYTGETDIFIYPGYAFKSVDALLTNFHLPESTLLMLISAFAGKDEIMRCYSEAIQQKYRFFSYGDAMFIS